MSREEQQTPEQEPAPPAPELFGPQPRELPVSPPPRDPFWGYTDLFLFAGLAVPAFLAGWGLVKTLLFVFGLHPFRAAEAVAEQFAGYVFLFLVLVMIFRFQYDQPFWRSLAWKPLRLAPVWVMTAGWVTAFAVTGIAYLIRTPVTSNPLTELMQDRPSLILIGIFGVTVGPLAEELIFRGFLQPLLVRTLGVVAGILVAAIPFGLLHFPEYGDSWRHAVLITGAGAAFGWMRQATGSTKSSTLMHAAYNALFFVALWGKK
jgi:uncharacterized protein